MKAATEAKKPIKNAKTIVICLSLTCSLRQRMTLFINVGFSVASILYLRMMLTSPFCPSLMMLLGVCGLCSCLRVQQT